MAACLTPVIVKNDDRRKAKDFATNIFPCGKCPNCVKRRVQMWTFRLLQEQKISLSSVFMTLTYNDENLPFSDNGLMTLHKPHFQNFMKRLRKHISNHEENVRLKYYTVGEYGSQYHRPHFHSIMFNIPRYLLEAPLVLETIWSHGTIRIDPCNAGTIGYVTGYVNKKTIRQETDELDDRLPECSMMSKGMGKNYLTENIVKYYKENLKPYMVIEGGVKMSIPRYYKDKIYTEAERELLQKEVLDYLSDMEVISPKDEAELTQWAFHKANLKNKETRKAF